MRKKIIWSLSIIVVTIICTTLYHRYAGGASVNSDAADDRVQLDCGGGVKLELVKIPAGTFMMGSPESEKEYKVTINGKELANQGRDRLENQHKVTLSKSFYMGIHEVTQAQYEAVTGKNPSYFKGADLPVETVSWNDAVEFCGLLSTKTGHNVRLPTEAEWEYACRARTTTPFSFGETIGTDQANYYGNDTYGNGRKGECREKTMPVGSFPPNAWGLYDMHGNVLECCSDQSDDRIGHSGYPEGDAIDPKGASHGSRRMIRGGGAGSPPVLCRSASRVWIMPDTGGKVLGFRIVLE